MKHIKRTCTPYHFAIDNLFNELSTEAQKQIARKNLRVSDEYRIYYLTAYLNKDDFLLEQIFKYLMDIKLTL